MQREHHLAINDERWPYAFLRKSECVVFNQQRSILGKMYKYYIKDDTKYLLKSADK